MREKSRGSENFKLSYFIFENINHLHSHDELSVNQNKYRERELPFSGVANVD